MLSRISRTVLWAAFVASAACNSDPPGDGLLAIRVHVTADGTKKLAKLSSIALTTATIQVVERTQPNDPSSEQVLTVDGSARSISVPVNEGVVVDIAALSVQPGTITQIRFILHDASAAVGGNVEALSTPSAMQSGLKLVPIDDVGFQVQKGRITTVEAEFDPNRRLVVDGAGLKLKPTIPTVVVATAQTGSEAAGVVEDELTVLFQAGTSEATIDQILNAKGIVRRVEIPEAPYLVVGLPDGMSLFDGFDYFKSQSAVDVVLPNTIPQNRISPDDPDFSSTSDWATEMNLQTAWDITQGSDAVTVAVLEAGFNINHPDVFLNVFVNEGELPGTYTADVGQGRKAADCNNDGLITFRDLNCMECTVLSTDKNGKTIDPQTTCQNSRALIGIPSGTVTPSVLAKAVKNNSDDDHNGFADDVVGWDFIDGDNDPDTATNVDGAHGTEMMGVIGAITNNALGVAGTAWRVRLIPLRSHDRGRNLKAIDYATRKLGAQIVNYSQGDLYFAGKNDQTFGSSPCLNTTNGEQIGKDRVNSKRADLQKEWTKTLDLSRTLLSVAAANCGFNLDETDNYLDWPTQFANPSVVVAVPNSTLSATGAVIGVKTARSPGRALMVDGSSGAASSTDSSSYAAAFTAGIAVLVSSKFPSDRGPCLRTHLESQGIDLDAAKLLASMPACP